MYKTNQIAVLFLLQALTSCCLVLCFFVGSSSPDSGRNQDAVALGLFTGKHRQVSDVVWAPGKPWHPRVQALLPSRKQQSCFAAAQVWLLPPFLGMTSALSSWEDIVPAHIFPCSWLTLSTVQGEVCTVTNQTYAKKLCKFGFSRYPPKQVD